MTEILNETTTSRLCPRCGKPNETERLFCPACLVYAEALAVLQAKNEWRGGLSDAEESCFEAGWDLATEQAALKCEALVTFAPEHEQFAPADKFALCGWCEALETAAAAIRESKSVAVDNILPDSDTTE